MKRFILILIMVAITGCAAPREPAVKVIIQEVKIPVRELCIQKIDIPRRSDYITVQIQKENSRVTKAKKLIVHYKQSTTYINALELIIAGCSE